MTKRAIAEVTLDGAPSDVSNVIEQIMWSSKIKVKNVRFAEQPVTYYLYGEHSVSFRSWGENVKITITAFNGGSKVNAESVAKLETTLFDYGQNKENLEILMHQLILKFRQTSSLVIKEAIL